MVNLTTPHHPLGRTSHSQIDPGHLAMTRQHRLYVHPQTSHMTQRDLTQIQHLALDAQVIRVRLLYTSTETASLDH